MPNININRRVSSSSSLVFSPEANALFAKWETIGTPCPSSDKIKINEAIVYLKSTSQWDLLDCLYKFDVHSKLAATVDWKNPITRTATIINDYAGSFTPYVGFNGNGTDFRIETNFNPSTATNYTLNSAIHGVQINTKDASSSKIDMSAEVSAYSGLATAIFGGSSPLTNRVVINNASDSTNQSSTQMKGWQIAKRTASNLFSNIKNGQNTTNTVWPTVSTSSPNLNVNLFCRNLNNVYSLFSNRTITSCFFGSGSTNEKYIVNGCNIHSLSVSSILNKAVLIHGNSFTAAGFYPYRVFDNISSPAIDYIDGLSGISTTTMTSNYPSGLGLLKTDLFYKKVLFMWELTNDMVSNASNATTCYNNLVSYCSQVRALQPDLKIIVATTMPRNAAQITNANRQNDANLLDDTTLNGKIRNHLVQDGFADAICDTASDLIMGIYSNGVAGVGEKNTTYYNVDEVHPNATGYNYLADNYITASINAFL